MRRIALSLLVLMAIYYGAFFSLIFKASGYQSYRANVFHAFVPQEVKDFFLFASPDDLFAGISFEGSSNLVESPVDVGQSVPAMTIQAVQHITDSFWR